jgi:N-acetylmuramate 1-kinase
METGTTLSPAEQERVLRLFSEGTPVPLRAAERLGECREVTLIAGGGSDRGFYRLRGTEGSAILMLSPGADEDFRNFVEIAEFFTTIGVPVPEIYWVDFARTFVVMEDVGDESLYRRVHSEAKEEHVLAWYQEVLAALAHLQAEGGRRFRCCRPLRERVFDYSVLRWETEYFQQYFLEKDCGITIPDPEALAREFHDLAEAVAREPLYLMHRDFQSQNLMLHQGHVRILDFQGARQGLLQYDLAAVLKDAYVVLSRPLQQTLVDCYVEMLAAEGVAVTDRDRFWELYTLAGLQRNMQALGAFSFLSLVKGKTWFRQYIPAGIQHLSLALRERNDFPQLQALVESVASRA